MRIKLPALLILLFFLQNSFAQSWDWYKHFKNPATIVDMTFHPLQVSGTVIDANKNVIVYGLFKDTVIVDEVTYISAGITDLYLAKYNKDGILQWFQTFGGTNEELSQDIAIDATGNVFITGAFQGTTNFQGQIQVSTSGRDGFIAKINSAGIVQWLVNAVKGTGNQFGFGIDVDVLGNIYLSGTFKTQAIFDSGTLTPQKALINNYFAKFNSIGTNLWAKQITCSNQTSRLFEIEIYNYDEIYLAGFVADSLFYDNDTVVSAGSDDIVLIKVNSNGARQWIRRAGSTTADRCNGLTSDIYGNIYMTGYITGTATFDSTGLGSKDSSPITSKGGFDMFVAKYNKGGNLRWKSINGNTGDDIGYGASTFENIVQFSGYFSDKVIFNLDTLQSSGPSDQNTGFFVYSTTGKPVNGKEITGTGTDRGTALTFDIVDAATYIGGYFNSDTLHIGSNQVIKASANQEGFIAKYSNPFTAAFTTISNITCNGLNNGRLIVTPYFGVGPYSYTWSGNVTSQTDSLAYNLAPGTYSVTITDSLARTAVNSIDLISPSAINISAVLSDASCAPPDTSNNGSIDLTVTGGTVSGPYVYTWTALSGSGVFLNNEDQLTLTAGQYIVTVTDDNLCTATDTFTINEPDPITFGGSDVTDADSGFSNGSIDLEPAGGTLPYTYLWSNAATTQHISSIPGGSYIVTVTDSKGCNQDTLFFVNDTTLFIAYILNKVDVDCKGNSTGSATVTASRGTLPLTCLWKKSDGTTLPQTSATVTDLPKGKYYVTVTDNSFPTNTDSTSVQITEPAQILSFSITGTNLNCYEDNSGSIDLNVSGGTLPYTFLWSNSAATEDLINIAQGTYSVTVTDVNLCKLYPSIVISQPPNPIRIDNISEDQSISCNGNGDGIVTAHVSGGTGDYSYIWNDPGDQFEDRATGLFAGTYTVTVSDIKNCSTTKSITLLEPQVLVASEIHFHPSCFGLSDGSIILTVTGGTPGTPAYNFGWSSGQITQNIGNLSTGNYSVTVTDAHNCKDSLNVALIEPAITQFQDILLTDASCNGYSDGAIAITAAGGSGIYQYSSNGGLTYQSGSIFNNLTASNYSVRFKDNNDCESSDSTVTLNEPVGTTISQESVSDVSCNGSSDGNITITATNPLGTLIYSIDDGISYLDNGGMFESLSAGSYTVLVQDTSNCIQAGNLLIVSEPDPVTIDTTITQANDNQNGMILAVANGGTAPFNYVLTTIITSTDTINDIGEFADLDTGEYALYALDDNLCSSDTLLITITQSTININITVYDAFSPNGDGINDKWNIPNINVLTCKVTIFNTWGVKVFTSNGYTEPWDGKYNGKYLPAGTYYYVIDPGDGSEVRTGPVSLIR